MSSELDSVIQLGHDITSFKYYTLAAGTILFYDYLLTLADEIKYAWSGTKSWTFWLFIVNRYFPMTYHFWQFAVSFTPQSESTTEACNKTSWYALVMFVVCTLLAQVILTVRIHAITMKNTPVSAVFATITTGQLVLGIWMVILAGVNGAEPQLQIPFDAYHLCVFAQTGTPAGQEIAYTSISLFYDCLAFALIILLVTKSKASGLKVPRLLGIIAEDATWYFLVIFTSHFVVVMTLSFGRRTIRLLPGPSVIVFLPLMVSRIMLSLRKAANSSRQAWSLMEITTNGSSLQTMKFLRPQKGMDEEQDDISLEMYPESQTSTLHK